jgi:large subunit ribosomal protein L4
MELAIYNIKGEDTGRKAVLNDEVFAIEANEHAVYLDVKQYLANQRQGTHKSKERSEVSGSTRKLHKQKGGGGSRVGDINSPVLVGGGRVFGPRPRDYRFKLNKKLKQLARKSALTTKAQSNQIVVVEDFSFEAPKTKDFVNFTKNLKLDGQKVLLVFADQNKNVYLSARNVPGANIMTATDVNTYALLNNNAIILTEVALTLLTNFNL